MPSILDLKIGQSGYITSFANNKHACKLLSLGLLPKSKVRVLRYSPLGDALYLKIDHQLVAVRKMEAAAILIEFDQ